jgi:hypothetical protein
VLELGAAWIVGGGGPPGRPQSGGENGFMGFSTVAQGLAMGATSVDVASVRVMTGCSLKGCAGGPGEGGGGSTMGGSIGGGDGGAGGSDTAGIGSDGRAGDFTSGSSTQLSARPGVSVKIVLASVSVQR